MADCIRRLVGARPARSASADCPLRVILSVIVSAARSDLPGVVGLVVVCPAGLPRGDLLSVALAVRLVPALVIDGPL